MKITLEDIQKSLIEEKKTIKDEVRYIVKIHANRKVRKRVGNIITVFDKVGKVFVFRVFCSNGKIESNLSYIKNYYGKTRCKFPD